MQIFFLGSHRQDLLAYHSTRLKSVLDSWLGAVPNKFVVTDGPVRPSLGQLQASEVIVSPDFELEVFLVSSTAVAQFV